MNDLDKIRVLMAIKHGRLPERPKVTREVLTGPDFADLVHPRTWGWGLTVAGHDMVSGWRYDVVRDEPAVPTSTPTASDEQQRINTNSGHGHACPRPDGMLAKCGGPAACPDCSYDQELVHQARADAADAMWSHTSGVNP